MSKARPSYSSGPGTAEAMQQSYLGARTAGRSRKSLVVRGCAARTFGSIVAFLAATLLTVGGYVLIEVIAHPLEGQSTEIIVAAVMIALAAIMMFYLIEPRANGRSRRRRREAKAEASRAAAAHFPALPVQRQLPFEPPRPNGRSVFREPSYEFTLRLSESPRGSVLREGDGDAVHGRR